MDEQAAAAVQADPDADESSVIQADEVDGETANDKPHKPYQVVRFIDKPGIRVIYAADWAAAGVPDHPDTWWNLYNDWSVKRDDLGLNDEQFARIILMDRGFRVEWE